jgi:hypothetical protein
MLGRSAKNMTRKLFIIVLSLFYLSFFAEATSYAPPKREEIHSPSQKYLLVIDPATKKHVVSLTSTPNTEIWSFSLPVWHSPVLLSNDGQTVAVIAWRHVQEGALAKGDCVTFYRSDGSKIGIPFGEVYPNPPKTSDVGIGPIGDFWHTWYHSVEQDGDIFSIATTNGGSATLDIVNCKLLKSSRISSSKSFNLPVVLILIIFLIVFIGYYLWRRSIKMQNKSQ